jgi:hypothetical protein
MLLLTPHTTSDQSVTQATTYTKHKWSVRHTNRSLQNTQQVISPSHRPLLTQHTTSDQSVTQTAIYTTHNKTWKTNVRPLSGIRTHNQSNRAALNLRLRPHGQRDRLFVITGFRTKQIITTIFWVITQPAVLISYRHFGTTCRSHLQGTRISGNNLTQLAA